MIKFKLGVHLYGLQPESLWAIDRVNEVYGRRNRDCVVTSSRYVDAHGLRSFHYLGMGVDFRTNNLDHKDIPIVAQEIITSLGDNFDVVLERTHIHIEYQPERILAYPEVLL